MNYKNYIFDLYGTLIDIHTDENPPALWDYMADYLKKNFDTSTTSTKLREDYLRICSEEIQKLSAKNGSAYPEIKIEWVWSRLIGRDFLDSEMRDLCTNFRETSREKFLLYPGVIDVFKKIRENNGRIYLLSNAQRIFTEKELQLVGLTDYFDDIFISSDMGIKKPDGDFINSLMKKHSLKREESVMVGNEVLADIGSAVAAGIDGIYLNTYHHSPEELDADLKKCGATDSNINITIINDGDNSILTWGATL